MLIPPRILVKLTLHTIEVIAVYIEIAKEKSIVQQCTVMHTTMFILYWKFQGLLSNALLRWCAIVLQSTVQTTRKSMRRDFSPLKCYSN